MRSIRSRSPPPRSPTPEVLPRSLPSPRRKPSNLHLGPPDVTFHRATLRSSKSAEHLYTPPVKFELTFDEFGGSKAAENTITFPSSDESLPSPGLSSKRGHRRTSALSPRRTHANLPPSSPRPRTRSRSPPPIIHKSPPPPLPEIPSFLLSAAHKTTDEWGLRHLYLPNVDLSCSISSRKRDEPLKHLEFFAAVHQRSTPPMTPRV